MSISCLRCFFPVKNKGVSYPLINQVAQHFVLDGNVDINNVALTHSNADLMLMGPISSRSLKRRSRSSLYLSCEPSENQLNSKLKDVVDEFNVLENINIRDSEDNVGDEGDETGDFQWPDNEIENQQDYNRVEVQDDSSLKEFMLDSIAWYKSTLSPNMPKNCRFLPTCSSYGVDSIKRYGSVKGGILTVWRILRCNPFGGCGYDAPQWPPPGFRAGSNTKNLF